MSSAADAPKPLPPKLRRALELVYNVEGVVAARVWYWPGRIAVGIRGGSSTSPTELLRRVEVAVAGLREPNETWDFGILDDAPRAESATDSTPESEAGVSSTRRSPRSPS